MRRSWILGARLVFLPPTVALWGADHFRIDCPTITSSLKAETNMFQHFTSRLAFAATSALFVAGILLAPLPAAASHGIKCGFLQTGVNTYTWVCGVKGP